MSFFDLGNGLGFQTVSDEDLKNGKLIDVHRYTENGITYEQCVYRLHDHTIYTTVDVLKDLKETDLRAQLTLAIEEERFEEAAILRDKLK